MSTIFESCGGFVHAIKLGAGTPGVGLYKMDPALEVAGDAKVLLTGAPLNMRQIFQTTTTLDDRKIIYSYGKAWSDGTVSGLILMGPNSQRGDSVSKVIDWYNTNSLYTARAPIKVSIGNKGLDAFLVGLTFMEARPDRNIQPFTLQFSLNE